MGEGRHSLATERSIRYLRDYVAIPSVNPMGRSDVDPAVAGERRYAAHLREQLRGLGLDAELIGDPERPSVVAEASVAGAKTCLMVASHIDTVPVDGMEIDPFDPRIEDGRLYGRGSCDTKAGMAALVAALEHVLERGTLSANLLVVGEADEEKSSTGVYDVLRYLGDRRPDWVLATEPTELRLVTRHKGVVHARLRARGVACHSSNPGLGRNAIVAAARGVLALDELAAQLARREDERLGSASLSVGVMAGGSATNIVPDDAWFAIDRRLLPGEDDATVRAEMRAAFERHGAGDIEIESCRMEKPPLATDDDHPAVRRCLGLLGEAGLSVTPAGAGFGTDAGVFAAHGIPGVVLGPGSIEQAHTAREWVEVAQVETMERLYESLLTG